MKKYRAIFKRPGEEPTVEYFSNGLKFLDGKLGGKPEALQVKTEEGKKIVIFRDETAVLKAKDYNFTLMVVPEVKRSWIDIIGDAIIFGRTEEDNIEDCSLTLDEARQLMQEPYDE